jgi:hypothetical protein
VTSVDLATRAPSHFRQPACMDSQRGLERLQVVVAGPVEIGAPLEQRFRSSARTPAPGGEDPGYAAEDELIDVEFKLAPTANRTLAPPRSLFAASSSPRAQERVGVVPGLGRAWSARPASPAYSSQPSHARSAAFGCRELHGRRADRSFPPGSVRAGPPMRGRALGVSARTECGCAACHHRRTARVVTHVASSPNPAYGRPTSPLEAREG